MRQTTISFGPQTVDVRTRLQERAGVIHKVINTWLDTKSAFYSRIASMPVTRRTAIRVNMVTVMMVIGAIAIETQPLAALLAAMATAWIMYRTFKGKGGKA